MSENTNQDIEKTEEKQTKISAIDLKKASNTQIEKNLQELEEYNNRMDTFFDKEREAMNKEMNILFAILGTKNYKDFIELQSNALALRQTIQEKIGFYMKRLSKSNTNYKKALADRVEYYMTGYGIKVSDGTRTKLIDRDLSERERNIETLQTHIEYLRECRNGCDQIGYAVKNLVGLISYINILEK